MSDIFTQCFKDWLRYFDRSGFSASCDELCRKDIAKGGNEADTIKALARAMEISIYRNRPSASEYSDTLYAALVNAAIESIDFSDAAKMIYREQQMKPIPAPAPSSEETAQPEIIEKTISVSEMPDISSTLSEMFPDLPEKH